MARFISEKQRRKVMAIITSEKRKKEVIKKIQSGEKVRVGVVPATIRRGDIVFIKPRRGNVATSFRVKKITKNNKVLAVRKSATGKDITVKLPINERLGVAKTSFEVFLT